MLIPINNDRQCYNYLPHDLNLNLNLHIAECSPLTRTRVVCVITHYCILHFMIMSQTVSAARSDQLSVFRLRVNVHAHDCLSVILHRLRFVIKANDFTGNVSRKVS